MILCTHAVVGAALASFLPSHPAAAFVLGFASHFTLDAIPHWDYPIRSNSVNPLLGAPLTVDYALMCDVVAIGGDGLCGIIVSLLLFATPESGWQSCWARLEPCSPTLSSSFTPIFRVSRCERFSGCIVLCIPNTRSEITYSSALDRSSRF
jgi:hypothetical protein